MEENKNGLDFVMNLWSFLLYLSSIFLLFFLLLLVLQLAYEITASAKVPSTFGGDNFSYIYGSLQISSTLISIPDKKASDLRVCILLSLFMIACML